MTRLDSLSSEELKKLYVRSAWLYRTGQLGVIYTFCRWVIFIVVVLDAHFSAWEYVFLPAIAIFSVSICLAASYVFMYVRTSIARNFFYIWSVSNLVLLPSVIVVHATHLAWIYLFIALIMLLISVLVLKSARTDALFGTDVFSHEQIAWAKRKKFGNECFADEDLPKSVSHPKFSKICVIVAFVHVISLVIENVNWILFMGR